MKKQSILFVCLGNICRSPMAESVMDRLLAETQLSTEVSIDSAGCYGYHEGERADARMRQHASARGYKLNSISRPITTDDFEKFDLIIGMDDNNIADLMRKAPSAEAQKKIRRMTDYCSAHTVDHIPDPYYGGADGFDLVIDLLEDACSGLIKQLSTRQKE